MTSRLLAGAFAASVLAVVVAACDDGTVDGYYDRGGDPCAQYASCGDCTPVLGCGWCTTGVGKGQCASDPDECASAPSFSWTWNASGCFAPADAGVTPVTDASSPSPSPTDAALPPARDSGPPLALDASPPPTPTDAALPDASEVADASDAGDAAD